MGIPPPRHQHLQPFQSAAPTVGPARWRCSEKKRDRVRTGRAACSTAPLPECGVTQDIGRWQRKFKGKTQLFMARASVRSETVTNLRQILACTRADGEVLLQCSILFNSQFIIIPHLKIPCEADVCPVMPGACDGWTGR